MTLLIYHQHFPCLSALFLACLTFKHFHSHSGVTSFSFESECCCLNHFSKLSFTQCLAKNKVFTRKLPFWILLFFVFLKTNHVFDFLSGSTEMARKKEEEKPLTGILKVSVSMDSCEPRRMLAGKLMGYA